MLFRWLRPTNPPQTARRRIPVGAPSSLRLPESEVPGYAELESDARERASEFTAAGAADEFNGHALDEFYHRWHDESVIGLAGSAMEQRHVDRVLVDAADHHRDRLEAEHRVAAEHADRQAAHAEQLWAQYFPTREPN